MITSNNMHEGEKFDYAGSIYEVHVVTDLNPIHRCLQCDFGVHSECINVHCAKHNNTDNKARYYNRILIKP